MSSAKATDIILTLNDGSKIPALGFGTGNPAGQVPLTKQAVIDAVKAGYRHIDTGWRYQTEGYIGEALQELFAEGYIKREDVFVVTKVPPQFHKNPEEALNQSLARLKLEYVNLLLQHWPLAWEIDANFYPVPEDSSKNSDLKDNNFKQDPSGDYLSAYLELEKLVLSGSGKVKSIGVSNYPELYLAELLKVAKVKPTVNQIEIHPHLSQPQLIQFHHDNGIIPFAYGPLGMEGAPNLKIPLVVELAEKYSVKPNIILLSYHLRANRGVIARSVKKERILANLEVAELTNEDLARLDEYGVTHAHRYNDKFVNFKELIDNYYK